ncbi:hypothetical protein H2O64_01990 [Kordia sp. YSTF-M3]|uniref:Uncharacterized protein n=2 Tax=Kordia aestuariivivens TaxID=2759037 RepID=A0ABR7Q4I0_9FLAO|nr:hypothetical protein [Kordia aestuariivivens]
MISYSQENRDDHFYTSTNIETGYSYSFGKPNNRNFHLLSIGINKTNYGGRHGGGFAYGIGTDIGLNTRNFTIGPKINGFIYYQFIVIGSELIMYTDFSQTSIRYVPIIGIGGEKFKLTVNPQVILSNKDFQPIDKGSIQLTVNFPLDRKQIKFKK